MIIKKHSLQIVGFIVLPIILLFINESWAYNPLGWLDHWGYYGTGFYYPRAQQIFPQLPISEIIPISFINTLFFNTFDPVGARLFKASSFLTLGLGLVYLISYFLTGSKCRSYIASVAYGTYLYTLSAAGADYTEIYVQLELLLSIFCILGFYRENSEIKQKLWLAVFGFSISLLILTAILSVVYITFLVFFILIIFVNKNKNFRILIIPLVSFFCSIGLFGMALYSINGSILLLRNIQKLFSFLGGVNQAPAYSLWIGEASWLIFPSAIAISSIFYILLNSREPGRFFNSIRVQFIAFTLAILVSLVFINTILHQWSLQFLYFGQTTPLYFIVMSILIPHIDRLNIERKIIFCIYFTILSLICYFISGLWENNFLLLIKIFRNSEIYALLITTSILTITLIFSYKSNIYTFFFLSIFAVFNISSFSPSFGCFTCADGAYKYTNKPIYINSNRKILLLSVYLSKLLDVNDYSRNSKIWFSDDDNLGAITRQTFAMNYLNNEENLVNKEYPHLLNFGGPSGSAGRYPKSGDRILGIIYNEIECNGGLDSLKKSGLFVKKFNQYNYQYNDKLIIKFCEYIL